MTTRSPFTFDTATTGLPSLAFSATSSFFDSSIVLIVVPSNTKFTPVRSGCGSTSYSPPNFLICAGVSWSLFTYAIFSLIVARDLDAEQSLGEFVGLVGERVVVREQAQPLTGLRERDDGIAVL